MERILNDLYSSTFVQFAFHTVARAKLLLLLVVLGVLPEASAQTVATLAGGNGGTLSGSANGVGTIATFSAPSAVALSAVGSFALVVSTDVLLDYAEMGKGWMRIRCLCMQQSCDRAA